MVGEAGRATGAGVGQAPVRLRANPSRMRSWCSGAATAMRSQSAPRPGKVSPRRTAIPRPRSRARTRVASRTWTSRNGASPPGTTVTPGSRSRAAARLARHPAVRRACSWAQTTASGWLQATSASRARLFTGHGGWARASRATRSGSAQQVADTEPGQAPGLGQAAHHDQAGQVLAGGQGGRFAGHGVGEGLVHDQGAARPGQAFQGLDRVQARRGVGRVAEHDQVGVGRDQVRGRG